MPNSRKHAVCCQYGKGGSRTALFPFAAKAIGRRTCPHPETQDPIETAAHLDTCAACLRQTAPERDPASVPATLAYILAH
jgi:hypothetical protein